MSLDLSSSFHQFSISMRGGGRRDIYAFEQFKLDIERLMLYRDGVEVSIPPKVAKTLAVLVESAGTIISKEEVIERVWDDSIVEESNLTQYLYLLRKVLGNTPDGRPYIETLRRRGYRFNGEVERILEERPEPKRAVVHQPEHAPSFGGVEREGNVLRLVDWKSSETIESEGTPSVSGNAVAATATVNPGRSGLRKFAVVIGLLIVIGGSGYFLWPKLMPAATNAGSQPEPTFVKLTNGVFPNSATISPDGNVFVYDEVDGNVERMFVQQTGQASRIEIASSSTVAYAGKTFSIDGKYIFYVGIDRKTALASVYRIPVMGGGSVKLFDDIHGSTSFSPDGREMVFARWNATTGDTWIVISGSDGKGERIVAQRTSPRRIIPSPAWSPDGKTIAFADRDAFPGDFPLSYRINLLNIATGKTTYISAENWENVLRLVWSPDGKGIFAIATRDGEGYTPRRDQLYFISYPEGLSYRLTNEGNRHDPDSLSVSNKGEIFSVSSNRTCQIWVVDSDGNPNGAAQVTRGFADGRAGIGVLPDGRFAYVARNADELTLMLSDPDGSNASQIPTGFSFVEELRADPQGRFIVFATRVKNDHNIYRIDVDGANLKKLTSGSTTIDSSISPDGKQLMYDSFIEGGPPKDYTVYRMSTDGGESVPLVKSCMVPTYSPEGSLASCVTTDGKPEILIFSASDGKEVERHPLPAIATWNFGIGWTADGSGLVFIGLEKSVSNLWVLPRDGGKTRQLTNFTSGIIYRYAFSPDGSKIYVARGYPTQDAFLIKNFRKPMR